MTRAAQAIEAHRFDEALPDIETVIDDPRLVDYLREERLLQSRFREPNHPSFISVLQIVSSHYCDAGRIAESKRISPARAATRDCTRSTYRQVPLHPRQSPYFG